MNLDFWSLGDESRPETSFQENDCYDYVNDDYVSHCTGFSCKFEYTAVV